MNFLPPILHGKISSVDCSNDGWSLEADKDIIRPQEDNEEVLGPEIPYLGVVGALMYLVNNTRPNITFVVNLLARFSSALMDKHWYEINHIFCYLRRTINFGLFFPNNSTSQIIGCVDAGYLLDPHFGNQKIDIDLHIVVQPFPWNPRSKLQWQPQQITQNKLQYTEPVENVFDCDLS